jgi:5-methylcytosine-specific restriction endonuclease McrA
MGLKNTNITVKERNLIKGDLRRVFSRSEHRKVVLARVVVPNESVPASIREERPRVKTWCKCESCSSYLAKSEVEVDHIVPIVPLDQPFEDMSLDVFIDRLWATPDKLQGICETCHKAKTSVETKERARLRKLRKA